MSMGFVKGTALGCLVAAAGLVGISQLSTVDPSRIGALPEPTDLPPAQSIAEAQKAPVAESALPPQDAPAVPIVPDASIADPAKVETPAIVAAVPAAQSAEPSAPATLAPATSVDAATPGTETAPVAGAASGVAPASDAPSAPSPDNTSADQPAVQAATAAPAGAVEPADGQAPVAPQSPAAPTAAMAQPTLPPGSPADTAVPAAEAVPLPPLTAEEQQLVDEANKIAAAVPPAVPDQPSAPAEQPAPAELPPPVEVAPTVILAPEPELPRAPTLDKQIDGVTTGRLPSIVAAPASPPVNAEATVPAGSDDRPPVERFAQAFDNPTAKPVFAVVLQDTGGSELDREALAALPFPVTFAIDPNQPDAATAAKLYRNAGKEVLILAAGLPEGANPSDLAVSFDAFAQVLPEAVAVLEPETGGYQANRNLAAQVLAVVKDQGRGVLSWDRGLNATEQIARREGMRNAVVFRQLDADGEEAPLIRRYLDRAAFKAAQDGRVVVTGQTRPETVKALLEWAVEGRAASVAMAPVTAALTSQ